MKNGSGTTFDVGALPVALIGLLPASLVKNVLLRIAGWRIDDGARIGPGIFIRIGSVHIGSESVIGPFNVFRDLTSITIGCRSSIGQWNWISAATPLVVAGGLGSFKLGEHSALTSRHYVDCSGGVEIGHHSTVAGVRSTFLTHGIDWRASLQRTKPITVGNYCLLSSNLSVTPGTSIADAVVIGMGATVAGIVGPGNTLYVGERAVRRRSGERGKYFSREENFVHPAGPEI